MLKREELFRTVSLLSMLRGRLTVELGRAQRFGERDDARELAGLIADCAALEARYLVLAQPPANPQRTAAMDRVGENTDGLAL